ncbi:opioid growth factor receptor conserved region-domain-containing protein [Paraphoma chrysanthemicola]|uniref:Opioid growth factor receptor conserved region-domain-containing protein n=1 Tax=Paraphoma chrysanthemicola TaxID=798071 RepID=A0A8K0VVU9_9PLEO|nr:opioid growth factor receptor conserved region-domain-containing protein [Paraphoma chrysanthemicola]
MDRSRGGEEQDKVRAARVDYFNLHKRKVSSTQTTQPESATLTTTSASNTSPETMDSSKRFKFPGMTSTKPTPTASKTPFIVRFYDANIKARDAHGRTQEDILNWPDSKLESCHNYIQMLFPVPEGSAFNWEAPIIDREVMETFRTRSKLRSQLRRSFERMLSFYGFESTIEATQTKMDGEDEPKSPVQDSTVADQDTTTSSASSAQPNPSLPPSATSDSAPHTYRIVRASHWRTNFRNWAVRFDHNHLRITRILRCLRILGLQRECDAFFEALTTVFEDPAFNISERSMMYWTRAVTRPLYIAPDDDRVEWLKEWEKELEAKKAKEAEQHETLEGDAEGTEKVDGKADIEVE